jgi:hypothetical protein
MTFINEEFFRFILPDKRIITRVPKVNYRCNNIIFKNILIYGFQASGKTTAVNSIASQVVKKYGEENTNCVISESGDLGLLMEKGLQPKLVNLLFADNVTLRPLSKETLMNYFRIRHIFRNRFDLDNGYILSIISLHRFFSIPIELRTTIDGILIKDSSINPYDRSVLRRFVGQDYIDFLEQIAKERDERPELKQYSIFIARGLTGVISLPMVRENYLKEVQDLKDLLKEIGGK